MKNETEHYLKEIDRKLTTISVCCQVFLWSAIGAAIGSLITLGAGFIK